MSGLASRARFHWHHNVDSTVNSSRSIVAGLALVFALFADNMSAADTTVQPPAGGGFVVTDNAGVTERLRVDASGAVTIPGLPAAAGQNTPQCFDNTTGVLGPCASGVIPQLPDTSGAAVGAALTIVQGGGTSWSKPGPYITYKQVKPASSYSVTKGLVPERSLSFTKQRADSVLRVTYTDTVSTVSCYLDFAVDGVAKGIRSQEPGGWHKVTLIAVLGGVTAGVHTLDVLADCDTGAFYPERVYLEVQEIF